MKIRPMGVELFHADGQTDMTQLIVAFRNFAKAPANTLDWPRTAQRSYQIASRSEKLVQKLKEEKHTQHKTLCVRHRTSFCVKEDRQHTARSVTQHTLYQGVLHFQNVIRFLLYTMYNFLYAHDKSANFPAPTSAKLTNV